MANKLKPGNSCASCVLYPETDSESWILTKVDKKLPGNRFLVRDEYADDPKYETYQVDSSHITPFPSSFTEEYKVGDIVLALWRDEETNEWSTMFYNAEIVDNKSSDNKTVKLLYSGTDFTVEVEKDKIARLPSNFTFTEVKEDIPNENLPAETTETQTKDENEANDNQNESKLTNENTNEETTPAEEPSVSDAASSKSKSDVTSEDAATASAATPRSASPNGTETEPPESKTNEGTTTEEENQNSNSNEVENSDTSKSIDQNSEKNKRTKTKETGTTAQPKLQSPESRRIQFMFHRQEVAERPKLQYLSDEDFTKLAGPKQELERMHTIPGTPLLEALADPDLFNQENLLHITGSGVISVADVERGDEKSGLAEGKVPCGRLKRIINEWTKSPMDSV